MSYSILISTHQILTHKNILKKITASNFTNKNQREQAIIRKIACMWIIAEQIKLEHIISKN